MTLSINRCPHETVHTFDERRDCSNGNELELIEWEFIDELAERTARYSADEIRHMYNKAIKEGHTHVFLMVRKEEE